MVQKPLPTNVIRFTSKDTYSAVKHRYGSLPIIGKRLPYNEEEDKIIMDLRMQGKPWIAIATLLNRTSTSVRQRYIIMQERRRKEQSDQEKPWLPEEDMALREAIAKYGSRWRNVSEYMRNRIVELDPSFDESKGGKEYVPRSYMIMLDRADELMIPRGGRQRWTFQEDLSLIFAIMKHGNEWEEISAMLGGQRTQRQCYSRAVWLLSVRNYVDISMYYESSIQKVISVLRPQFAQAESLDDVDWVAAGSLIKRLPRNRGLPKGEKGNRHAKVKPTTILRYEASLDDDQGKEEVAKRVWLRHVLQQWQFHYRNSNCGPTVAVNSLKACLTHHVTFAEEIHEDLQPSKPKDNSTSDSKPGSEEAPGYKIVDAVIQSSNPEVMRQATLWAMGLALPPSSPPTFVENNKEGWLVHRVVSPFDHL